MFCYALPTTSLTIEKFSLSPPHNDEDLSDEGIRTYKKDMTVFHLSRNKQQHRQTLFKQKTYKLLKLQTKPKKNIHFKKVEITCEQKTSALTHILKDRTQYYENLVDVFIPIQKGGSEMYKVSIAMNQRTTGMDLMKSALRQFQKETGITNLPDDFDAYMLRVAQIDGRVDTDWPALDKNIILRDLGGCDKFALLITGTSKSHSKISKKTPSWRSFVLLRVYLPREQFPRFVQVAQDMLLKQLMQLLADRFKFNAQEHTLRLVVDGEKKKLTEDLRNKSFYHVNVTSVTVVETRKQNDDDDWIMLKDEKYNYRFVPQSHIVSFPYQEFRILRPSKFGKKMTRLGIDGARIYIYKSKSTSFLGSLTSQKDNRTSTTSYRLISNLISIERDKENPKIFRLIFDEETLSFEAETNTEAAEIVQKITYLLQVHKQQQDAQRRSLMSVNRHQRSTSISSLSLQFGNTTSPSRGLSKRFSRIFHKRSKSAEINFDKSTIKRNQALLNNGLPMNEKYYGQKRRGLFRSIVDENVAELLKEPMQDYIHDIFHKQVTKWDVDDVGIWLEKVGFADQKGKFKEEEVDGEVLLSLTERELRDDFGLELEQRKKLFMKIVDLKCRIEKDGKVAFWNDHI